jgi:hypothetical protein
MKTNAWLAAAAVVLGTCGADRPLAQQRFQTSDDIEVRRRDNACPGTTVITRFCFY